MAAILELVTINEGDPSVGIQGYEERVTIIFHGESCPSDGLVDDDTAKLLCETFAEIADGCCVKYAEWMESIIKDRIAVRQPEER